jgi:hypothetical protein
MAIPNPHDSVLDLHMRIILIQLSQTDDRVSQHRNIIDSGEQYMLTRLNGEDDRADALDLHVGGVPKLDGASDIGVKLSEELPSIGHVMGGAGVEAPPVSLVVAGAITEEVCSRLIKVENITRCLRVPGAELTPPLVRRGPGRVVAVDTPRPNGQVCYSCGRRHLVPAAPPWAPPRVLPSARPRVSTWAPPRALLSLRPLIKGEDPPFFP